MNENCLDIGAMQAFLDGELDFARSEAIAKHVAACNECATMLAVAEDETAFAFSALEQEFNTLVPTQRLWTKINDSIEREKKSFWKPIFAFLLQPSTAALASLILVFAVVVSLLTMRPNAPTIAYVPPVQTTAGQPSANQSVTTQPVQSNQPTLTETQTPSTALVETNPQLANLKPNRNELRADKAIYVRKESGRGGNDLGSGDPSPRTPEIVNSGAANRNENLSGEESYIKTIAALTETVNNRKDEVLNSSARFAFEKDLAMTNNAIKDMKAEVEKNPKNEAAKQILRASYQNKIDLLNSVAEKNELMATVK